ncbi:hypothetical protein FE782_18275 [Paenibacillus antri]|uniref:Uncharacterized protein n=1 Tax=Paenibacillus antri TaxID=2582848 RepID=A0A5R9GDC3_9BACL|nr:hypothetical protein [Paenibacillus antri]TLS50653.1 hypothetical protein FE782_18275 [Paenibacillus antri]
MAKKSSFMKRALKQVQREMKPIVAAAVRAGVERTSSELRAIGGNAENQTSAVTLGKFSEALKAGVFAAGQELMDGGLRRLQTVDSADITSGFYD